MSSVAAPPVLPHCQAISNRLCDIVAIDPGLAELLVIAMVARGHVLIEGVPGIGKTLLARTLAASVSCSFHRIQFTNDLMPSDVVGTTVWRAASEKFVFVRGPLFAQIVLADEINRTSPRTLSCLLEAMENNSVSVEGRTLALPDPFMVLATRNPIEFHGTYPMPEAALDRFLLRVELGYPAKLQEIALYRGQDPEQRLRQAAAILTPEQVCQLSAQAAQVHVSEAIADYAYRVVTRTRSDARIQLGASPRACLMWLRAARARACVAGRDHVLPDDLKRLARSVLAHRVVLRSPGDAGAVIDELLASTPITL